ncbi:hypothetical protein [Bdellovibrio bacteriovorus]|uniref:Uncharacterized protein n=1 Tax=Bdellovibrio bacteriovorus str. Tiberius TaxID=1069642 RepID=K7YT48_BDEBC|nr:hypothetical protein [Bdellovibrio bacteriovorus]AFY00803.1 Hypothetical protein Bdt_1103 [Bdellovibrio bacteriovorus str. Tiberius]
MSRQIVFTRDLSGGQSVVRELARSLQVAGKLRSNRDKVAGTLRRLCLQDTRIRQDKLLSQNLREQIVSPYLLDYLSGHSEQAEFFGQALSLEEPFRFIYNSSDFKNSIGQTQDSRLFYGGVKHASTFACILALDNREALESEFWGLRYFPNEGILTTIAGGTHRTLAHLIFGDYVFTPKHHVICKSQDLPIASSEFNEVLSKFRNIVGIHSVKMDLNRGSQEIDLLVRFVEESESEFKEFCSQYISLESSSREYSLHPLNLRELLEFRNSYLNWKQMTVIRRFQRRIMQSADMSRFEVFLAKVA